MQIKNIKAKPEGDGPQHTSYRPLLNPADFDEAVELPVRNICWQLFQLGLMTTTSTANKKDIGRNAHIMLDMSSMNAANKARALDAAEKDPAHFSVDRGIAASGSASSLTIRVAIPDGEMDSTEIEHQFTQLLNNLKFSKQLPIWMTMRPVAPHVLDALNASETPEERQEVAALWGAYFDERSGQIFPSEEACDIFRERVTELFAPRDKFIERIRPRIQLGQIIDPNSNEASFVR